MFEAIKKFARRHKDERKKSLLENAKRIMEHDHVLLTGQGQNRRSVSTRPA